MTVKELKEILDTYNDDLNVAIQNDNGEEFFAREAHNVIDSGKYVIIL